MSPRLVRTGAIAILVVTLALAALVARDVAGLVGRPYPGFPVLAHGVVSVPVMAPARFGGRDARLRPPYRVVAIDGRPVHDGREVRAVVDAAGPGAVLTYRFAHPGGETFELPIPVATFTAEDVRSFYLPIVLGGLVLFVIGAVPVLLRPDLTAARLLFVFSTALEAGIGLLVADYVVAYRFTPWLRGTNAIAGAALLHLALAFPERRPPLTWWPRATLAIVWAGSLVIFAAHVVAYFGRPALGFPVDVAQMLQFVLGFVVLGANCLWTARTSPDPRRRRQALVVLPGPIAYAIATMVLVAGAWNLTTLRFTLAVPLPGVVMGLSLAYAMLQHNVFEFDAVVRRGLALGILAAVAAVVYLGLFVAVSTMLGPGAAWAASAVAATLLLLVVPMTAPLWTRVEGLVERALFPDQRRARHLVHAASRELARLRDEETLARFVRETVARSLGGTRVCIVAGRPDMPLRELGPVDPARPVVVPVDDPLHAALRAGRTREDPASRTPLAVGLPPQPDLIGGLLLEARPDGRLYTSDDAVLLETLAGQAAAAIENARAWEEVRALERRLAAENTYLRREVGLDAGGGEIVGRSLAIRAVLGQIAQVAPTDVGVLVEGESGTGKELVVRALHAASPRARRVLVTVACAAVPETLIESELFGHERGAFTGATSRKEGRFEIADGGTLFLDDVDTLPLAMQAKLLRALQEGETQRLGSNVLRRVDVRVVAATNRDLLALVRAGRFREDLYYRLNVVPIRVPPLRERREDVGLLAEHFLRRESAKMGRAVTAVAPAALAALEAYDWPGNVRELRNVIERALVLSDGPLLELPEPLAPAATTPAASGDDEDLGRAPMPELLRRYKHALVAEALARAGGNHREAAALLGIHRPSLTRMLRELDLGDAAPPPRRRPSTTRRQRADR